MNYIFLKARSVIIPALFFMVVSALPAYSELTPHMTDPLGQSSTELPLDSAALQRKALAEELDTYAPQMSDPGEDAWWKQFNDPTLDWLIQRASQYNLSLASAIRSIEATRYSLKAIQSGYYPSLSASAMYQSGQTSGAMAKGNSTKPIGENYMGLSLDLSWEIDIFGRIRKQTEEATASYNASRAEYVATLTSLCAQVASVYFDLAAARELYATALSHLESEQKILDITNVRLETGLSSKLDACQALTVVLDTKASIPSIKSRIEGDINMLALLTNSSPEEIKGRLNNPQLPICDTLMVSAIEPELMRRRPDVAEAEYNLAAACAKAGLAKKDWLPTLSLSASIATESHSAKDLFTGNSLSYSVAPTLAWTIFDGFERKYSIAEAKQGVLAAADTYDYTIASARQEVATATSDFLCLLEEIELLKQAAEQSYESLNLSLELYKSGLDPFTDVANSQVSWLSYENSVINAKYNALSTLITLYKALGGGWNGELPSFNNSKK